MSRTRWQHLDRQRPAAPSAEAADTEVPAPLPAPTATPEPVVQHPALRAAAAYYQLGQFHMCADAVTAVLAGQGDVPGARRLLGLAQGATGDYAGANAQLALAVAENPGDSRLRASLLSAQLALGQIEATISTEATGPEGELAGAGLWLSGQRHLQSDRAGEAAQVFGQAVVVFGVSSPPDTRGVRLGTCYLGAAISHLLADQPEAAGLSFSRCVGSATVPEWVGLLARQVYEIAEVIGELPADDRRAVLAPLAELVLRVRLRVKFYDQLRPVAIQWDNLP